jgi:hypothetical protein
VILNNLPNESIYDNNRLALPDEVWNFKRGDGIEKALLLADILVQRDPWSRIEIRINNEMVSINSGGSKFRFTSVKKFNKTIEIENRSITIESQ